jgi:hypothetical protein
LTRVGTGLDKLVQDHELCIRQAREAGADVRIFCQAGKGCAVDTHDLEPERGKLGHFQQLIEVATDEQRATWRRAGADRMLGG